MELNPRRSCRSGALALIAALASCTADTQATAVELVIRYDSPPARLSVTGRSEDGTRYGPESLPDPPRPLAAREESVLLQLSDAFDQRMLDLDVAGLDAQGQVTARGSLRLRVVKGGLFERVVKLQPVAAASEPEPETPAEPAAPTHAPETGSAGQTGSGTAPVPAAEAASPPATEPVDPAVPIDPAQPVPGSNAANQPPAQAGNGAEPPPAGNRDAGAMQQPPAMPGADEEDAGGKAPLDCEAGKADCKLDCAKSSAGCGAVHCDPPAKCLLECKEAAQCAFASCPSGTVTCSKNRLACNRACP